MRGLLSVAHSLRGVTLILTCSAIGFAQDLKFEQSASTVPVYDFFEIAVHVPLPRAANPFADAAVAGTFIKAGSAEKIDIEGFCDSADGSLYRIRFMPSSPGVYDYSVTYRDKVFERKSTGAFTAVDGYRRGPIRVDPKYPWHFIWQGTGEHYFFNGTTAYWLAGWRDERIIQSSLARLQRLKVNRLRVTIAGRTHTFYGEAVMNSDAFSVFLSPWPATQIQDIYHPGFDYARFNVAYWQKFERMLRFARDRDLIVSLVLDMNDSRSHPEAGSEDEHRYIHYAVDRLGAFSNITWDLGDDLDGFRDDGWTHETGTLLESWDPYRHLATSHPMKRVHQDRSSPWFGFTSIQDWSRRQHELMLEERAIQIRTGRIIPQTNEEYGYEDHYPAWTESEGSDSADTLRRTAWDIAMAGAYGTTGESARRGTNIRPDTGGGWINGRGDDTMTMLVGYSHMVDFFTSFEWWKTDPHDELVNNGAWCLAEPGRSYAIYLPHGGNVTVNLAPGVYQAEWFSALAGDIVPIGEVQGGAWKSLDAPDKNDWAILLRARM